MKAVYSRNRYTVKNILESIKEGNIRYYTNMPRNVFGAQQIGGPEPEPTVALGHRNRVELGVSFLSDVAPRYPNCNFVTTIYSTYSFDNGDITDLRAIYALAGDEPLGVIEVDGEKLAFYNDRINADVKRGDNKKTSKLSTAKAIFAKYFYGMTMLEHMKATAGDVAYEISSTLYNATRKLNHAEREVTAYLNTEIAQGSQPVIQLLADLGRGQMVDNINDARDEKRIVENLDQAVKDNAGYYVMLQGDDYFKWAAGESMPKRFKRDEMPSEMRTALGLLRIADKGTFVDGAGFKLADDKFFIRNEVKLEFDD